MLNFEFQSGNPVLAMLDMVLSGSEFEVVETEKTEPKYYINERGEYVRYDKA